jgi:hypothetical protein
VPRAEVLMSPTPQRLSPAQVESMAATLAEKGLHPAKIRRYLRDYGIRWDYQFQGQGAGERLRRLRQQGLGLCTECRQQGFSLGNLTTLCPACLEKKWQA